jgi:hypothetical protein
MQHYCKAGKRVHLNTKVRNTLSPGMMLRVLWDARGILIESSQQREIMHITLKNEEIHLEEMPSFPIMCLSPYFLSTK